MQDERDKTINICDECHSEYYQHTSRMLNLCPECSHVLYGYPNCDHHVENGRCVKCYWNGSASPYITSLKNKPR